jgi:hypothetical protein
MSNSDTPEQGIGIPDAAAAFDAFLAGTADNQTPEEDSQEASTPGEVEALEASTTEDETPEDAEDGDEGAEEEEADTEDEESPQLARPDQLVTVVIDGKAEQVTVEEAAKGYQRSKVFSQKTEMLARERNELHQVRSEVIAERQQYAQLLTALQQQLSEVAPQEPDWNRLYAEDPLEYVRQKDVWRERQEQQQATMAELQRVQYLQMQEQAANLQKAVQQGRQKLAEWIPAWQDQKRWDEDRKALREYGRDNGFSDEELSQAYDPRAVRLMWKALQYDRIMSKRPKPAEQASPKPAKPGVPVSTVQRRTSEVTKAKQRLAATGRVRDAAAVFETLI